MTFLQNKYLLNILSWKTQSFYDGTFRSSKVLNMEFKELPEWFDMSLVGEKNQVNQTPDMLRFVGFSNDVIGVKNELIVITLIEKEKANSMIQSAKEMENDSDCDSKCSCDCESDCGCDFKSEE